MDRGSMKKKKRQSACYKVSKRVFYKRYFITETEKQLKKGEIQFYTEKIPLQTRVTLAIFTWGWDVHVSGDSNLASAAEM